jgi:peroxiredoxin
MKKFILLTVLLYAASTAKGQEAIQLADKTIRKIRSCKTISHYSFQKWGSFADETDFSVNEGECIFKIEPADTVIGSYYCLKPPSYSLLYNGKEITSVNWKDSTLTFTNLSKYPKESRYVTSKSLYNHSVVHVYNLLKQAKKELPHKMSLLKDTTINGALCKRLLIVYGDTIIEKQRIYSHRIISIDAKSYLPQHSMSINKFEFGKQIIEGSLSAYKINDPHISQDMFTHKGIAANLRRIEDEPQVSKMLEGLKEKEIAPDWSLPVVGGDTMSLSGLKGKVVLLEFSGVNCGFCLIAVPELNKLQQSFDPAKFSIVSIYSDSPYEKLIKYGQKYKISFPILYNGKTEQEKQAVREKYLAGGIPQFFLIDQKGAIAKVWTGYQNKLGEELGKEIEKLLK